MSKMETVRALNDSGPQLQIVESVMVLQQSVSLMHKDLKLLPEAISTETAAALEPLERLQRDLSTVLEIQRRTLGELTQEMAVRAAATFEQKAGALGSTISSLSRSLSAMEKSVTSMEKTARQVEAIPEELTTAQKRLTLASDELRRRVKPRLWLQMFGLILAGVVGGLAVGIGQAGFAWLVPLSSVQQNATWAVQVWSKATPKERALLLQIARRPLR